MLLLCVDFIKYIAIIAKAMGGSLIVAIISRGDVLLSVGKRV
jgi:hypothetical protein